MQEFRVDKKDIIKMKVCLAAFLIFIALYLALPFFSAEEQGLTLATTLIGVVVFGFFSIFTWRVLKTQALADVAADDDGIWYIRIGKDKGLVAWKKIYMMKERLYMQRLDLLDCNGQELLRVEYQLLGFEMLRNVLNEKTSIKNVEFNQSEFSKGPLHHFSYLVCILGFSVLGFYAGKDGNLILGYGATSAIVAFISYEYLVTVNSIKIRDDFFIVGFPLTKRIIRHSDIEDIFIADEFYNGNRIPVVWIVSKNENKPIKLKLLGADSSVIYHVLQKATNKQAM